MQQINFYNLLQRPSEDWLRSKVVIYIWCTWVFILLFIFGLYLIQYKHYSNRLRENTEYFTQAQKRLTATADNFAIADMGASLVDPSRIKMCHTTYSQYLDSFSSSITPGIWLTSFQMKNNGNEMSLSGKALKSALIQQFMDKLRLAEPFEKTKFELQSVNKNAETLSEQLSGSPVTPALAFTIVNRTIQP